MKTLNLIMGSPASGKSGTAARIGCRTLNRDAMGGTMADQLAALLPLLQGDADVTIDNTFPTRESRKPFIDAASSAGWRVVCHHVETSADDCTINACQRMFERYGRVFLDHKEIAALKDPNMFPPAPIFAYQKNLQKPDASEGFHEINRVRFVRRPRGPEYSNRGLILDLDGTLRTSTGPQKYPTRLSEQIAWVERGARVREMQGKGWKVFAVTNQSGVAKGHLTLEAARELADAVARDLGFSWDEVCICPHAVPPITCYCRKPQSGIGVHLIEKYKLDPSGCAMVGDMTSDRTWATRLGIPYTDQTDFFRP